MTQHPVLTVRDGSPPPAKFPLQLQGQAALDSFASEPHGAKFETVIAEGHTARLGSTACNQTLSLQRAEIVRPTSSSAGPYRPPRFRASGFHAGCPAAAARSGAQRAGSPIRAQIFGRQRFEQHGGSFVPRLRANIAMLRLAHLVIAGDGDGTAENPSPAVAWLLDNFHPVEAPLEQVRPQRPRHSLRSLPVLADAPLAGLPRNCGVGWAFVARTHSAWFCGSRRGGTC
jgi:OmpA family